MSAEDCGRARLLTDVVIAAGGAGLPVSLISGAFPQTPAKAEISFYLQLAIVVEVFST
jgi:hypothetical protein